MTSAQGRGGGGGPVGPPPAAPEPHSRWSGGAAGRVLGLLATGAVGVLAAVLAAGPVAGGLAAWGASAQRASAPVSYARVGDTFVPRGAGTGGATYSTGSALNLVGGTALVDLVSTSSVPVHLTGTVTTTNLLVATRVTITACTLPWQGSTCPGTTRAVLNDVTITSARPVTWSAPGVPVAAGGSLYLRLAVSGSLSNSVVLTAVPAPARAPGDRTAS